MVTLKKLKIYKSYNGDSDSWARLSSKKHLSAMEDSDWALIDSLMSTIIIVKRGYASDEIVKTMDTKLSQNCDSEETIVLLKKMADFNIKTASGQVEPSIFRHLWYRISKIFTLHK
jgi:hypothetical protein